MTDLRAAAQQALEALKDDQYRMVETAEGHWEYKTDLAIAALEAALAQQAEPDAYGYASRVAVAIWEKHYKDAAPQWKPLDDLMGVLTQIDNMTSGLTRLAQQAEPVEPVRLQCVTCGTVYADGVPPQVPVQQAEPVEPVAWRITDGEGDWDYRTELPEDWSIQWSARYGRKYEPLYTAPPQRKPLSEEEIDAVWDQWFGAYGLRGPGGPYTRRGFARAIERAHGITDPQIEDRLARHGIPMPGDPK